MNGGYPVRFVDIPWWAKHHGVALSEARKRFAQFAVLCGIARSRPLREGLVFKGGNALDFIWAANRSTLDLDFSLDSPSGALPADAETLRRHLERGLAVAGRQLGVWFAVRRIVQNPPGRDRTFITFRAPVHYALPDQPAVQTRLERGEPVAQAIPVEISVNEAVCETTTVTLADGHHLRVSTIDDIVAEKLRALLQQTIRNRERRQDLLDIAVILSTEQPIDRARVRRYRLEKAAARNIVVSRDAFHNPELARRASVDYAALSETTRHRFIAFEDAMALLLDFVDGLELDRG